MKITMIAHQVKKEKKKNKKKRKTGYSHIIQFGQIDKRISRDESEPTPRKDTIKPFYRYVNSV